MDCENMGNIIRTIRKEKGMTQKQLSEILHLSDKTVSKWERGLGCPDVSLLSKLSEVLEVNIEEILNGNLAFNNIVGGNMKKIKYYVCPVCGNISFCTGEATVSCCGRKLQALVMKKATDNEKLQVENIENDYYITSNHPMEKDNFISFVAFVKGDEIQLLKQYPEWEIHARLQNRGHGMLIWYSTQNGLFYQLV